MMRLRILTAAAALLFCSCSDQLLPPEGNIDSANPERILFTRSSIGEPDSIFAHNVNTQTTTFLAEGYLASAPQAGSIAYYSATGVGGPGVYVGPIDGPSRQLIFSENPVETIVQHSVTLSQDGSTIAFLTMTTANEFNLNVYASGATTTVPLYVNLAYNLQPDDSTLWLSPDGQYVAFTAIDASSSFDDLLCLVDWRISSVEFSSSLFGLGVTSVAVSPDSKQVAIAAQPTVGVGAILVTDLVDPGNSSFPIFLNALLQGSEYYFDPAWSADGSFISFEMHSNSGETDLYSVSLDHSLRKLTSTPTTSEFNADWSSDGMRVLFTETDDPFYIPTGNTTTGPLVVVDTRTLKPTTIAENVARGFWSNEK